MKNTLVSRRNFLEYMALTGAGIVIPGCATKLLPTNTLKSNEIMQGSICTNEDAFEIPRVNIFGRSYFKMPLPTIFNNQENILNILSPSVYLIPEDESRTTETLVGEKDKGEINISSPTGNKYFPMAVMRCEIKEKNNQTKEEETKIDFKPDSPQNAKPLEIVTAYQMNAPRYSSQNQGVSIDILTEKDFPFYNKNVVKILQEYKKDLGTGKGDISKTIKDSFIMIKMDNSVKDYKQIYNDETLPFFAMSMPLSVIYDRSAKDNLIRLKSNTYVFVKGDSVDEYISEIAKKVAPNDGNTLSGGFGNITKI